MTDIVNRVDQDEEEDDGIEILEVEESAAGN